MQWIEKVSLSLYAYTHTYNNYTTVIADVFNLALRIVHFIDKEVRWMNLLLHSTLLHLTRLHLKGSNQARDSYQKGIEIQFITIKCVCLSVCLSYCLFVTDNKLCPQLNTPHTTHHTLQDMTHLSKRLPWLSLSIKQRNIQIIALEGEKGVD